MKIVYAEEALRDLDDARADLGAHCISSSGHKGVIFPAILMWTEAFRFLSHQWTPRACPVNEVLPGIG